MRKILAFPFHPFLWGIFPVVALLANNADQIRAESGLRSLALSLGATVVLYAVFRLVLGDWARAAIITSITLLLFFSYGHVYETLRTAGETGAVLARHRFMIPLWIGLWVAAFLWVWRRAGDRAELTTALNLISFAVLVLPLYQIWRFDSAFRQALAEPVQAASADCSLSFDSEERPPDIYLIVLDAYARDDVLAETYGYDNQWFIDALEERGFYVPAYSQSNYIHTELSLASMLNMDYVQNLDVNYEADSREKAALWPLLRTGEVRQALECVGYNIVTLDSGYYWSGWHDADTYLTPNLGGAARLSASASINPFEAMLIERSLGLILSDASNLLPDFLEPDIDAPLRQHRQRVFFGLDSLTNTVPGLPGPKFVYAHFLVPHGPFTFGPEGEFNRPTGTFTLLAPNELSGYRDQVEFINGSMLEVIDGVLAGSETPPIIILTGDHGAGGGRRDKLSILSAYHLPGDGQDLLYDTITPVNIFRLVFDRYLNGGYGLISDISYYSTYTAMYGFEEYPNPDAE